MKRLRRWLSRKREYREYIKELRKRSTMLDELKRSGKR